MRLSHGLLSLPVLLLSPADLEFSATVQRMPWTLNGQKYKVLDVEVMAKGAEAGLVVATRGAPELRSAKSTGGSKLELFVHPFFEPDDEPSAISRDRDDPEDEVEFEFSLLESDDGVEGLATVKGKIEVLMAKSKTDLEFTLPALGKSEAVKNSLLRKAKTNVEIENTALDALYFDFRPLEDSGAKVEDVDLDQPRRPDNFYMGGGVSYKIGHFNAAGRAMHEGTVLTVSGKDPEGRAFELEFKDLEGSDGLDPIDDERLAAVGMQGILQAKAVYRVRMEITGNLLSLTGLELLHGGESADSLMMSGSSFGGVREREYLLEHPPTDEHVFVAWVFSGLKWTKLAFEAEDVEING